MFIKPAFAEVTTAAASMGTGAEGASPLTSMLPIILILIVFYFIVIRPQNKRLQEHRNMVKELAKGDRVVTGGGLIATVKKVINDDELLLELADGIDVKVVRSTIMVIRSKSGKNK